MIIKIPPFVLMQETKDKFGYDPNDFNKSSDYTKKIIRTCFVCNNIYEQQISSAIRSYKNNQKCKYCSNKEINLLTSKANGIALSARLASGELIHSMLGKKHTQEAKNKISKFHNRTLEEKFGKEKANEIKNKIKESFTKEIREKKSKSRKGKTWEELYGEEKAIKAKAKRKETIKNFSKEKVDKIYSISKGKTLEEIYGKTKADELNFNQRKSFVEKFGEKKGNEMKEKISLKISGEKNPAYGKSYSGKWHFKKEWYRGYYLKSSYEIKVANYLDFNNIEWTYETVLFKLNNGTTYTPDFFLIKENKWIEIKGFWYKKSKEKFELFQSLYPNINIEIWNKEKLKSLGILN